MNDQGTPCQNKKEPHVTRFKEHLLKLLPDWDVFCRETKGTKTVYFSHQQKVVDELAKTHQSQVNQDEALILMRAAMMIHRLCLKSQEPFGGSFSSDCLTGSVNKEMKSFFNVVLQGSSTLHKKETPNDDACTSTQEKIACIISQLLIYNSTRGTHHTVKTTVIRHNRDRETPFPLYHGLSLHGHGRNKQQIETDHAHGISVSYSRVMEVKRDIARAVCTRHEQDGVVVPTNSSRNVFTTHDVDNIDSKAQGNFSQDEFHGHALTVTNHLSHENMGLKRLPIKIDSSDNSTPKLPDSYVIQTPVEFVQADIFAPRVNDSIRPSHNVVGAKVKDEAWMQHVYRVIKQDELDEDNIVTWAGYNSSLASDESVKPPAEIGIYPLFADKAASASSMKHAMELTIQGTEFLNPGQTSVLGADQPLYAIIKQLQWQYLDTLGENKIVAMMGALHIEDKMHLMMGKLLCDSGWTTILTQAQILTSGRAESTLNEHHIKRTRYCHQVSLMGLYILKQDAYLEYSKQIVGPAETFDSWNQRSQNASQFNFWSTVMELEMLMCRFVRSLREGDFKLYVQSCDELCSWFHALDHTNYARWLPVHVHDMVQLPITHPEVYSEFMKGNFVVQISPKKFSLIAKDQSHEQCNKILQDHGGATGLYENTEALTLFMLAGPECARIIREFEAMHDKQPLSTAHHEEGHSLQVMFQKDALSFMRVVEEMGNPFLVKSNELVALDTQCVMEQAVVDSLFKIKEIGEELYKSYVKERLESTTVPLSDTIKRNNLLTFANRPDPKKKGKDSGTKKHNMSLITQLFLSLQSYPDSNISDFLQYENQREPPSLADRGLLRSGVKSDILHCINAPTERTDTASHATVVILDMPAVIHMVSPTKAKTFNEYVTLHIIPFLQSQMKNGTQRVDAIWDNYPDENNLKAHAQYRRGRGARTKVGDGSTKIPRNDWSGFLKNVENKKELFSFISTQIVKNNMGGKLLLSTHFENVLSNIHCDISTLQPCNHSEADTRIFLHLAHAANHGHTTAYVRTVDSDIVVLAVRLFESIGLTELWIGFGTGKKYCDIPVHSIYESLGSVRSLALPLFQSLTGCDTTSHFYGCGKKTAWTAWNSTPELTDTLVALTDDPHLITQDPIHMQRIERFVVIMYSRGSSAASVNEARHSLFTTGKRTLENIPPTQAALLQHVKRALLQASFYWGKATSVYQDIPDFCEWGWHKDDSGGWQPLWTTLSDASTACAILLRCGCLKSCTGRCKCNSAGVRCTSLCKCEGGCTNNEGDRWIVNDNLE